MKYKTNKNLIINCGFKVTAHAIQKAINQTNSILSDLPATLFKSIDYKTTSSIVGAIFCDSLAPLVKAIVNPIEKGHPDIVPRTAAKCSEKILRNYPQGLEIKCTVGNVKTGANLRAGQTRIDMITGITWQAHHRDVAELLGLVWDFVEDNRAFNFPIITGAFYSNKLKKNDWGEISGTTGRNTKVTGMSSSGKKKMGNGWLVLIEDDVYKAKYSHFLKFKI